MRRKTASDLFILLTLLPFGLAFIMRESFFPFHSYDVYRKPLAAPKLTEFQMTSQAKFYGVDRNEMRFELASNHPFFFPFDRFLFSEVLFFNIVRVHERNPMEEKALLEHMLLAQLRQYNANPPKIRPQALKTIEVFWAEIDLSEKSENLSKREHLILRVEND